MESALVSPDAGPAVLEDLTRDLGRQLARGQGRGHRRVVAAQDRGMALMGNRPGLRAALFRMVDVAPACDGPRDLGGHLAGLLREAGDPVPVIRRMSDGTPGRLASGIAARGMVRAMAGRFIVGADPASATGRLGRLWQNGAACSVDLLGEATLTAAEADDYAARCLDALEALSAAAARWPERPALERDSHGGLPRVNLSVKVSALTPLNRPDAPHVAAEDAAPRLRAIFRRARELRAHVHVDAESLDWRDSVTQLVLDLLGEGEFTEGPSVGMVLQAYLRDAEEQLEHILTSPGVRDRKPPLTIRLVKGAYWDHETVDAVQHGWEPLVWAEKAESDRNFERLSRRLIDARDTIRPAIASHNLRSVAHAVAYHRLIGGGRDLEVQVLRGLGEPMLAAVLSLGLRARVYCPVGDLVAGMAYLVRRLLENSANDSFLAQQAHGSQLEAVLAAP